MQSAMLWWCGGGGTSKPVAVQTAAAVGLFLWALLWFRLPYQMDQTRDGTILSKNGLDLITIWVGEGWWWWLAMRMRLSNVAWVCHFSQMLKSPALHNIAFIFIYCIIKPNNNEDFSGFHFLLLGCRKFAHTQTFPNFKCLEKVKLLIFLGEEEMKPEQGWNRRKLMMQTKHISEEWREQCSQSKMAKPCHSSLIS